MSIPIMKEIPYINISITVSIASNLDKNETADRCSFIESEGQNKLLVICCKFIVSGFETRRISSRSCCNFRSLIPSYDGIESGIWIPRIEVLDKILGSIWRIWRLWGLDDCCVCKKIWHEINSHLIEFVLVIMLSRSTISPDNDISPDAILR